MHLQNQSRACTCKSQVDMTSAYVYKAIDALPVIATQFTNGSSGKSFHFLHALPVTIDIHMCIMHGPSTKLILYQYSQSQAHLQSYRATL